MLTKYFYELIVGTNLSYYLSGEGMAFAAIADKRIAEWLFFPTIIELNISEFGFG